MNVIDQLTDNTMLRSTSIVSVLFTLVRVGDNMDFSIGMACSWLGVVGRTGMILALHIVQRSNTIVNSTALASLPSVQSLL